MWNDSIETLFSFFVRFVVLLVLPNVWLDDDRLAPRDNKICCLR